MTEREPETRAERRRLTHVDRTGRPRMVDVSAKPVTARRAVAEGIVAVSPETLSLVIDGRATKGDVLTVAEIAGVMAAKRTSELIPLCHPLPLTDLLVQVTPDRAAGGLRVRAEAATTAKTGVEMEALTAVSVAALTIYDMVKGVERGVEIRSIRLISKSGGRSGTWERSGERADGDRTSGDGSGDLAPSPAARRRAARTAGRIAARPVTRGGARGRGRTGT